MKTIYLKSTTDGETLPHIQLSQPTEPGRPRWNLAIYQINNVPDNVDWMQVKNLLESTIIANQDTVFDYNDLGVGKIIVQSFRTKIKNKLDEKGMPIRQLAVSIDYDYSNLQNYLSGKRQIPEKILEKIFAVLGL